MLENLESNFPAISAEWDTSANSGISASEVHKGSGKTFWWKCEEHHSFRQRVVDRTARGFRCPVCSGTKVWPGKTDLATRFPELLDWWDFERAENPDPTQIFPATHVAVWWKCPKGHSFDRPCSKMYRAKTCPVCSGKRIQKGVNDLATTNPDIASEWLRHETLTPETVGYGSYKKVWWKCPQGHEYEQAVENRTRNGQGCPQCAGQKTIVGVNDLQTLFPQVAAEWHSQKNMDVSPSDVMAGSSRSFWWQCARGHAWQAQPANRTGLLTGCPFCAGRLVIPGETDLATKFPHLVAEWDGEKNKNTKPAGIAGSTHQRVWWICAAGHSYQSAVYSRAAGHGCSVCSGRTVMLGFNDLATTRPDLLYEWDFEKNLFAPDTVTFGSSKKVWWLCPERHSYSMTVANKSFGRGCAGCAVYGFNPEKDAYLYLLRDDVRGYQQIGITNSPDSRLSTHRKNGWEVLEVLGPGNGYSIRDLENSLKTFLRSRAKRFTRSENPGVFDGFTESWRMSVVEYSDLGLLLRDFREWEWERGIGSNPPQE